jgi:hypothetical protein
MPPLLHRDKQSLSIQQGAKHLLPPFTNAENFLTGLSRHAAGNDKTDR